MLLCAGVESRCFFPGVTAETYVVKLIAAGKTKSFLSNWRVTDDRRAKIDADTKELGDVFRAVCLLSFVRFYPHQRLTDAYRCVLLCVAVVVVGGGGGAFVDPQYFAPESVIVGMIMKLLTPLMKRMFSSLPEDLGVPIEQGVLEYPSHCYHVRAHRGCCLCLGCVLLSCVRAPVRSRAARTSRCALARVQVYLLFQICLDMRPDVNKSMKNQLLKSGEEAVLTYGTPPDDDELPMLMAQEDEMAWEPEQVPVRLLHKLFPDGRELANKFLYALARFTLLQMLLCAHCLGASWGVTRCPASLVPCAALLTVLVTLPPCGPASSSTTTMCAKRRPVVARAARARLLRRKADLSRLICPPSSRASLSPPHPRKLTHVLRLRTSPSPPTAPPAFVTCCGCFWLWCRDVPKANSRGPVASAMAAQLAAGKGSDDEEGSDDDNAARAAATRRKQRERREALKGALRSVAPLPQRLLDVFACRCAALLQAGAPLAAATSLTSSGVCSVHFQVLFVRVCRLLFLASRRACTVAAVASLRLRLLWYLRVPYHTHNDTRNRDGPVRSRVIGLAPPPAAQVPRHPHVL